MIYVWAILVFVVLLAGLAVLLSVAQRLLLNYGICTIDINDGARSLEVEGGRSLLSELYDCELYIPSACGGQGTCGYCKVTVVAGGGPVLPTELPYLTRQDIRAGARLACQVKVRQDLKLRICEEYLSIRRFVARVARARDLTHDIREIRLALLDPPEIPHRPGQYVQVQAPSPEGPVFRAYSISSPSYEPDTVELVVRLVPGGIGSTYLHHLRAGDEVAFTGPYGEFVLDEDPDTEIVCVGGGCGLAPMKNIVCSVHRRWPQRSCWLFFGCRTTRDVFYLDLFQRLAERHVGFHPVFALSEPPAAGEKWQGERGFVHLAVQRHLAPGRRRQAFLCGPPMMIEAVTAVLRQKGMRSEDIYYDSF
jgi:Na+-transporting NADH:ubiquinone oxidoreductase subunit F